MNKLKKIKKLTKTTIIQYYHTLAFPKEHGIDFVPIEIQLKAFEKLMQWQQIKTPSIVISKEGSQKHILKIQVEKNDQKQD